MKQQISPVVGWIIVIALVAVVGFMMWKNTSQPSGSANINKAIQAGVANPGSPPPPAAGATTKNK